MSKTTINEIEVNGIKYVPKDSISESKHKTSCDGLKYVLIRSYAAGVHIGYLKDEKFTQSGKVVTLLNTRRVWYWSGAASLSQLALEGSSKPSECKITVELDSNEIVNVIETIPLSEKAFTNLINIKTWKM